MNEELLTLQDLLGTIKRHRWLIVSCIVICLGLSLGLLMSTQKKFKATTLLNIQATYFQVPLLNDAITGSRETAEVQAQKQALLRLALNDAFLDREGEKYKLYLSESGSPNRLNDRERLRKNIEYFSTTATTFQISAVGPSPDIAFGLASDCLDQIISTLIQERQRSLLTYRESLKKQIESLGYAMGGSNNPTAVAQPELLRQELADLEAKVAALESQYTPNHPTVAAMRQKAESVRQMLMKASAASNGDTPRKRLMMTGGGPKGGRNDFYDELSKKVNYLDIVLELETNKKNLPYLEVLERPVKPNRAFFPKPQAFVIGGLLIGLILAGLSVGFIELKRATVMTAQVISRSLGVPLLGSLPPMILTADSITQPEGTRDP